MLTGYFRPDPAFPSQIVGVAWMDQSRVRTQLIAGTREPGGRGWPEQAQVPPALRSGLVAAFNSGWRIKDITGGFYADGRTAVQLRDGAASLAIDQADRELRFFSGRGQTGGGAGLKPADGAMRGGAGTCTAPGTAAG